MLNVRKFTLNREQTNQDIEIGPDDRLEGLVKTPLTLKLSLSGDVTDKKPSIIGSASGDISAICQVCTDVVIWSHQFEFNLHPIEDGELDELDDSYDPIIIEEGMLDLEDMLINELILSLPTVISHLAVTGEDCSRYIRMSAGGELPTKASPFAILEQLKSPDDGD